MTYRDFYHFADSCYVEFNESDLGCDEWINLNYTALLEAYKFYNQGQTIIEKLK